MKPTHILFDLAVAVALATLAALFADLLVYGGAP